MKKAIEMAFFVSILAAAHLYNMIDEFNEGLRSNLKALCAAVKFE